MCVSGGVVWDKVHVLALDEGVYCCFVRQDGADYRHASTL